METIQISNSSRHVKLAQAKPCVMALGFFDGVHIGHQQVIEEAKRVADEKKLPLCIMSFFPHPKEVLSNGRKTVPYLMPLSDKQRIFTQMGADTFYIIQFDSKFASLSPKEFVQHYLLDFKVELAVAGFDFTYGCRGEGNMDRMKDDSGGKITGIKVTKMECNGEKISSTLIRSLLFSGEVERISDYLGGSYQIEGKVTVNQACGDFYVHPYYLLPQSGVYDVTVSGKQMNTNLAAIVDDGDVKLIDTKGKKLPFNNDEVVRIHWNKRLPDSLYSQSDRAFHYQNHSVSNRVVV
ncbi:riboflavin kinase / FMN adenylyltransferase [Alteribacillus persepolensis]|uniref:FAD synthase n=1 Tax=Alteribacillus persepolensis TaxID=568899 RepID=A0A1G8EHT8_9BACI|nr:FAD synthetase family protein [Alteribacillus persepolensis]SDH69446.1 riboflavin kinase / FMN adenylyltransferase [Alteribacillus persepolensis]